MPSVARVRPISRLVGRSHSCTQPLVVLVARRSLVGLKRSAILGPGVSKEAKILHVPNSRITARKVDVPWLLSSSAWAIILPSGEIVIPRLGGVGSVFACPVSVSQRTAV